MDFAPYQSSPPEHSRVASPVLAASSPRASFDALASRRSLPPLQNPQPQHAWAGFGQAATSWAGASSTSSAGAYTSHISEFDTSLGLRLDHEVCLAYLALPPLGPILLLILERNSDYVRFHAWQSALLYTAILILHLLLSWSSLLSWLLFLGDLVLTAILTLRAYRDSVILDRFEVPLFGSIASRILDDE